MESINFGHRTDTGRTRKANQDSVSTQDRDDLSGLADGLFVVADGMGGRAGGEIASRVTVETVPKVVREVLSEDKHVEMSDRMRAAVHEGLLAANEAVFGQAKANPELRGMGTTCVVVLVAGDLAAVGNIGDSRVYLLREGAMRPLTHDHSLVAQHMLMGELTEEEARSSRYRNVITRAIGIAEAVEPDVELVRLHTGDTLLLCSDGLTNMLTDTEIARILARGDDPSATCENLVGSANAAGGNDNITAVVIRYGPFAPVDVVDQEDEPEAYPSPAAYPPPRRRSAWRYIQIPLLFAIVAGAWFMLSRYELHTTKPYLRIRKEPVTVVSPPKVNFSSLEYPDEPRLIYPEKVRPNSLAMAKDGSVYVIDATSEKVVRILADGAKRPTSVLSDNSTEGGSPGMDIDADGNLYLASPTAKAIKRFPSGGTERNGIIGEGHLSNPQAVRVDPKGNIYVIDGGLLKKFKPLVKQAVGGRGDAAR